MFDFGIIKVIPIPGYTIDGQYEVVVHQEGGATWRSLQPGVEGIPPMWFPCSTAEFDKEGNLL